jgi:hypothetical protein
LGFRSGDAQVSRFEIYMLLGIAAFIIAAMLLTGACDDMGIRGRG